MNVVVAAAHRSCREVDLEAVELHPRLLGAAVGPSQRRVSSALKAWGLGSSAPVALRSAFSPTIRGRDAELAVLGEQLDRVRSGAGAVLLITGAAGMGKSRLVGEGVRMAHRLGFSVGIGAAEPSESVAELAPLLRALFDGPEPLLDRAGLSSLHAAPEQRYWRLQDLQSLLERAAMDRPLLVFLDDVQWVDSGTVAALRALPPRLASLPIGWVLAMRPDQGPGGFATPSNISPTRVQSASC